MFWLAHTVGSMRRRRYLLGLGALLAGSGCERKHELFPALDAGNDAQTDGAPPYTADGGVVYCGDKPCACSNGEDDDDDILIDGFDPECTGPYDDDEATFATGEVKEGNPRCSDCFFDGTPGSGDDGCRVPTTCVQFGFASNAGGNCNDCAPSAKCVNECLPLTPNGCDCFGCCEIQGIPILLAETCSMKELANEDKCPRCVLTPESESRCYNPCGRCELCAGKTLADLPADCGGTYNCEGNQVEVCGGTNELCEGLAWCIQGCCAPILY